MNTIFHSALFLQIKYSKHELATTPAFYCVTDFESTESREAKSPHYSLPCEDTYHKVEYRESNTYASKTECAKMSTIHNTRDEKTKNSKIAVKNPQLTDLVNDLL